MAEKLDKADFAILAALQAEGRLPNVDLAERVALSPSPCLRRVRQLEEMGVIEGYRAVLNRAALGLNLTVFVEIKVGQHSRKNAAALQTALIAIPEVIACHMVSGTFDFMVEIVTPDLKSYEHLLSETLLTLPMVASIRSNFSLRAVKTAAPLPLAVPAS